MVDDDSAISEDLIEAQIRHLREGAAAPDLSALDVESILDAEQTLDIISALVNSAPATPPLAVDPVAIRLGLVPAPDGRPIAEEATDPVTAAVRESERRFSFIASPALTDGSDFERRYECRSMVEHVLVVVSPEPERRSINAAHARGAFAQSDDLSAVVYTSASADGSFVFTYGDCHERLAPATGWQTDAGAISPEPLSIALGRYFERSDPQWDAVEVLEASDALEGIIDDVATIVSSTMATLKASSPRLVYKKSARDFVTGIPHEQVSAWVARVQSGNSDATEIHREIQAIVESGRP